MKKTFIEPMFILILFFLLLSTSGFIMYNRAGDLIADNARLCPSCPHDSYIALGCIGKFLSNFSLLSVWFISFIYYKAAKTLD